MSADWYGGVEQEVEALGRTWKLGRTTRHVWREFSAWARAKLPDPVEAVTRNIHKVAIADALAMREMMRQDREDVAAHGSGAVTIADKFVQLAETITSKATDKAASYLSFGSPELWSLMTSPEGQAEMLYLLLQKYHADDVKGEEGRDLADDVRNEAGPHRLRVIFDKANGFVPTPKNGQGPGAPASP